MAQKEYLLRKEDLIKTKGEKGSFVFTHPFFPGEIVWNPENDSVPSLFQRIKEFGERNQILLSPELARICNFFDKILVEEDECISEEDYPD